MTPQQMATRWLGVWLAGVGIHGLQPAPHEPLIRWLLALHERAIAEHEAAVEALGPHKAAAADQLLREVVATQKETLPPEAHQAIRDADIFAVRSAEIAAIVWTLAGIDAYTDPNDNIPAWRDRLGETARVARDLDHAPAALAEARGWPQR